MIHAMSFTPRQFFGLSVVAGGLCLTALFLRHTQKAVESRLPPAPPAEPKLYEAIAKILPDYGTQQAVASARFVFNKNFARTRLYSNLAAGAGVIGALGLCASIGAAFSSPLLAVSVAVTSVALIVIWVGNRNRERFLLQDALDLGDEKQKIEKLSRGADIYGKVSRSGANPGLLNFPRGETISVLEWFAKYEYTQVVAYLLLLEPDARRRAQLATKALTSAKDQTIAQKFIDLGGNPAENIQALLNSILDRRLNMFEFYITNGVKLHADIPNYQAWQKALDERQQHLGNTGDAENSNLDPHFRTPFEQMLDLNEKSKFWLEIRDILNATMSVVRGSYDYHTPQTLYAPQTLYESLNKSGIRIRREYVEKFFSQLNVSSE